MSASGKLAANKGTDKRAKAKYLRIMWVGQAILSFAAGLQSRQFTTVTLSPALQAEPPSAFAGWRTPFADLPVRRGFDLFRIVIEVDDETE
jgi:hypothetical protein